MAPVLLPGRAYDRPIVAVDTGAGPGAGTIYVAASQTIAGEDGAYLFPIAVARSTDGGQSFSEPVRVLPNNVNNNLRSFVVLLDGRLLVILYDIGPGGRQLFQRFRIWSLASTDRGQSFGPPTFVTENAGGNAAEVASGPGNGPLYVVWDEQRGEKAGIYPAHSANGRQWSQEVRVSDTVPGEERQAVPMAAVTSEGTLGVSGWTSAPTPRASATSPTSPPRSTAARPLHRVGR